MNLFVSLLASSVLPTAAAVGAPAANATVQVQAQGQNAANGFGQFQALLAMMSPETEAGATGDTPSLSVFGVTPPTTLVTQPEKALQALATPPLSEANAGVDAENGALFVDPLFAQFSAPLVIQQQQTSTATENAAPKSDAVTNAQPAGLRPTIAPTQDAAVVPPAAAQTQAQPPVNPTAPIVQEGAQPKKPNAQQAPAAAKNPAAPKRTSATEQNTPNNADTVEGKNKSSAVENAAPSQSAFNTAPLSAQAIAQQTVDTPSQPAQQPVAIAAANVSAPLPTVVELQQMNAPVAAQQAGVPIDALAVHIARKFDEGSNQFEIRLHPADLGQLDISLTVSDDGHVQAVLRADRPETLDMLQKDARALEQQLRQAGLEVGSNALSFSLSGGNNGQRHAPFSGWPGFADANGTAGAAKEEAVANCMAVRVRDGVDIRV